MEKSKDYVVVRLGMDPDDTTMTTVKEREVYEFEEAIAVNKVCFLNDRGNIRVLLTEDKTEDELNQRCNSVFHGDSFGFKGDVYVVSNKPFFVTSGKHRANVKK